MSIKSYKPKVSKSNDKINIDIKNIYLSQVQYGESCGMTVVYSPKYMSFYVDKRGKNIGSVGTDNLYGEGTAGTKAVCLVGSSGLGLEGISGVNNAMLKENKYKFHDRALGACIWSYNIVEKDFTHPDVKLGEYALKNIDKKAYIGQVGCGVNATIGKLYSDWKKNKVYAGQGVGYLEIGKVKCMCITILNSIGVVHENGKLLHEFYVGKDKIKKISEMPKTSLTGGSSANTTLTIFVTNQKLDKNQMKEHAEKLHDVIENSIYPYATIYDGDCFFMLSTNEVSSKKDYIDDYKQTVKDAIKSVL